MNIATRAIKLRQKARVLQSELAAWARREIRLAHDEELAVTLSIRKKRRTMAREALQKRFEDVSSRLSQEEWNSILKLPWSAKYRGIIEMLHRLRNEPISVLALTNPFRDLTNINAFFIDHEKLYRLKAVERGTRFAEIPWEKRHVQLFRVREVVYEEVG